jgi:hypothetical protein
LKIQKTVLKTIIRCPDNNMSTICLSTTSLQR